MTVKSRNHLPLPKGLSHAERPFFNRATGRAFDVQAAGDVAEMTIYDEIGFYGITAADFRAELSRITAPTIRLRINSPGGDVFDGIAIYNDLVDHAAKVEVQVTGLAASAASIIAMAGDSVEMAKNSFLMIHNAWVLAIGNKEEMRSVADVLDSIDGALATTYVDRTGLSLAAVQDMMVNETWLTADAAVENGFADSVAGEADIAAKFDLSAFHNAPQSLADAFPGRATPQTKRDLERVLTQDAGFSRSDARAAMAAVAGPIMQDADAEPDPAAMQDAAGLSELCGAAQRLADTFKHS